MLELPANNLKNNNKGENRYEKLSFKMENVD